MHDGLSPTGLKVKFYLDSLRFLINLVNNSVLLDWGRGNTLNHRKAILLENNLLMPLSSFVLFFI